MAKRPFGIPGLPPTYALAHIQKRLSIPSPPIVQRGQIGHEGPFGILRLPSIQEGQIGHESPFGIPGLPPAYTLARIQKRLSIPEPPIIQEGQVGHAAPFGILRRPTVQEGQIGHEKPFGIPGLSLTYTLSHIQKRLSISGPPIIQGSQIGHDRPFGIEGRPDYQRTALC